LLRAQLDEVPALLTHGEVDRLLIELVPAGFDARRVEDFVDQVEEVLAAGWMSPT
jgi:hypothetical protein